MTVCVVIGGGPAGMMAAYSAALKGTKVILVEKNEKLGKKIYLTGKGRCNLTNDCDEREFLDNIFENRNFLYSAVNALSPRNLMALLEENGLKLKTERGFRVFPLSDKASDVTKTLSSMMAKAGVEIRLSTFVKRIICDRGEVRGVLTDKGEIKCDSVVLCAGGKSYPSTGSDGTGYFLAGEWGHTLVEPAPALTSFISKDKWLEGLAGLSLKNVKVTIPQKGKKAASQFGEMLFTHRGISGPIVLTLSCLQLDFPFQALIDLKPALDEETLDERIQRDFSELSNKEFKNSLGALMPMSLCPKMVALTGINPETKVHQITRSQRRELVKLIKNIPVNISGCGGFEEAIVTKGGINVKEVNPSTMESKLIKGLYFAGEVINAHGYTGGFNMHAAFCTGYLAGLNV